MFDENIKIILDAFSEYWGTGKCFVVFFSAMLYIYLKEENKKIKCLLVYFPITILLITLNPIFGRMIQNFPASDLTTGAGFCILW